MRNSECGIGCLSFPIPHSAFRIGLAHWLLDPFGTLVPVLDGADVGDAPLVAVPPVEPTHLVRPEPRGHVAHYDQTIRVSHIDTEGAFLHVPLRIVRCAEEALGSIDPAPAGL